MSYTTVMLLILCIIALIVLWTIKANLKLGRIYFEYGEYVPAPIQADLGCNLVYIAGVPAPANSHWGKKAISGEEIKAWKMDDGIITEMDLEDTTSYVQPVSAKMHAPGNIVKSATAVRMHIAEQKRVMRIGDIVDTLLVFILGVIFLLAICMSPLCGIFYRG